MIGQTIAVLVIKHESEGSVQGSALKQQSKFSRFANQSSHSANGKRPVTEMKASRPINTGRGRGSKRRSI